MSYNTVTPSEFFNPETQVGHLRLIACPGAEELTKQIDSHLRAWVGPSWGALDISARCYPHPAKPACDKAGVRTGPGRPHP